MQGNRNLLISMEKKQIYCFNPKEIEIHYIAEKNNRNPFCFTGRQ